LHVALHKLGHDEEADAILKQVLVIDPLTLVGRYSYAEDLALSGRFEEAHDMADQLLVQEPFWGYYSHADTSLANEGKIADGLSWGLKMGRESNRDNAYVMWAFMYVGEFDEARRGVESQLHWVDFIEGRLDEAIKALQTSLHLEPNDEQVIRNTAIFLYFAGRIDEALPLYERLLDFVPVGQPISGWWSLSDTMNLALARRKAGDEEGAQAAAQIVRQHHAARQAAGRKNRFQDEAQAMIAAFDNNPEGVIAALKSAMQHGLLDSPVFDDPIYEDLWGEPRFVALQQELDAILAAEHEKVLQLICFNNPTPDYWQPLPETCEGVTELRAP
jgi:tetratricopeptide (TPR) repeat protein